MHDNSVRRQLIVWLMPPLLVLWLIGAVLAYYFVVNFANRVYDRWLLDSAVALSQQVHINADTVHADLPAAVLRILEYDALDRIYYKIVASDGKILVAQGAIPGPSRPVTEPVFYDGQVDGTPVRIAALRVQGNGASALVQVAETLVKRHTLTGEILAVMLLAQLLLIATVGVLIWFGVARGLRPLDRLRAEVLQRSHRDLSPLGDARVPAEVAPLVNALNGLFDRVNRAVTGQNRFIADAAHQLRTPLAGLKTQAELAMREDDPAAMRAALQRVQASVDRSVHLVNQLLALARADHSHEHALPTAPLDLARVARESAAEHVGRALASKLDLGFESSEEALPILGNQELVRELIDNLVDNALRYTPAGGSVTVRVVRDGTLGIVEVEDTGRGIAPAERERVLERFYRTEGTPSEGCGLGLAIVREIANLHGATIAIGEGAGGRGTRVSVRFAVSNAPKSDLAGAAQRPPAPALPAVGAPGRAMQ